MRLISCYIENFGKLSKYSIDFSDNLTVIKEKNGFGKTTLASFLRVMFYGMPRAAKNLKKNDRKRYKPWQGGKYGGNLVFETNEGCFRIERSFGEAPGQDVYRLIDLGTNRESHRFSENIGTELFELDSVSFERSTFMPQMYQETEFMTGSIQAKLSNLVEDTNDVNNFDRAVAALKKKRSALRAYKGSCGSIEEAQRQLAELDEQIEKLYKQKETLAGLYLDLQTAEEDCNRKKAEMDGVRHEMATAAKAEATRAHLKEWKRLKKEEDESTSQMKKLSGQYPQGFPEAEEIQTAEQAARELDALEQNEQEGFAEETGFGNEDLFCTIQPAEDDFDRYRRINEQYISAQSSRELLGLSVEEQSELAVLDNFFAKGLPEDELITEQQEAVDELKQLAARRECQVLSEEDENRLRELEHFREYKNSDNGGTEQKTNALQDKHAGRRQKAPERSIFRFVIPLLAVVGLLMTVTGIVLLSLQNTVPGAVSLSAGAFLLIVVLYKSMTGIIRKEIASRVGEQQTGIVRTDEEAIELRTKQEELLRLRHREEELQRTAEKIDARCEALQTGIRQALSPFCEDMGDVERAVETLAENKRRYLELDRKNQEQLQKIEMLENKINKLADELLSYLGQFYSCRIRTEDFTKLLSDLQSSWTAYLLAQAARRKSREMAAEREEKKNRIKYRLDSFLKTGGIKMTGTYQDMLKKIREDCTAVKTVGAELEQNKQELQKFIDEYGDFSAIEIPEQDIEPESLSRKENMLIEDMKVLDEKRLFLQQEILQRQRLAEELPGKQDKEAQLKEQLDTDERNCRILDVTMELLQTAKDRLSSSYLGTVQNGFHAYLKTLLCDEPGGILISPDLEIQLERYGEARELAYFSAGYTDTMMLCMRLALIDALFQKEPPFIILDDPFVNLDEKHTERALQLLEKLSQQRQIIYLVCNGSRC